MIDKLSGGLQEGLKYSENPLQGAARGGVGGATLASLATLKGIGAVGILKAGGIAAAAALGSAVVGPALITGGVFAALGAVYGQINKDKRKGR